MARVWLVARGRGCGPVRSLQGGAAGRRVPGRQPGLAAQRPPQAHIRANFEPNFARRVFGCLRPAPHGASCKVSFFVRPQCIISLVIDTALPELHERHVACGADRPELQGDSCTPALNHAHAQGSCHSTTDHQRSGHPHSASLPQHRARTNPHGAYCTPGLWDGS